MEIAKSVSLASKDPITKVGTVIVDNMNKIVSTAYNGFPAGMKEYNHRWESPVKYKYVVHSEANALLHAKQDLTNCKLYCTLEPCNECAKLICAVGIKEVYYSEQRENLEARELFILNNVKLEKI